MKRFINIGVAALRKPGGEPMKARPLYISPDDGEVKNAEFKQLINMLAITHRAQSQEVQNEPT